MAKLKIGDVRQEYIDEGWTLLTTEYVNLETEMESKCPEGHLNFISHKKWRARKVCSTCLENNVVHVNKSNIGPKEPGVVRILALDAATKDTGWSVFDNNQLVDYGIMRIGLDDPIARMALLRQWLVGAVDSWKPDRVAIEDIQLQSFYNEKTHAQSQNVVLYKTLAQLQGTILVALHEKKVEQSVIHVATWRSYCGITAKKRDDQKRMAQLKVHEWYGVSVNNDVAEAICIGKYMAEKFMKNNVIISWE